MTRIVTNMKVHKEVQRLLHTAQDQQRCAFTDDPAMRMAMNRRRLAGEYVSPFAGMYIEGEHWMALSPCQQSAYVIRTLHLKRADWVFTGASAMDVQNLSHSRYTHDGSIWIADHQRNANKRNSPQSPLRRVRLPNNIGSEIVNGVPVTPLATTAAVSIVQLPFMRAMPIIDDALRHGISVEELERCCRNLHLLTPAIRASLFYGNPNSESGGESMTRAAILLLGFAVPEIQVEFRDPHNPGHVIRVDFLWRLADGRLIVLEFDGMQKYVDPKMTQRNDIRRIIQHQSERDAALRQLGATMILHCFYEDVVDLRGFEQLLRNAGVPWVGVPEELQGELSRALRS